jgi:hypothetical protein
MPMYPAPTITAEVARRCSMECSRLNVSSMVCRTWTPSPGPSRSRPSIGGRTGAAPRADDELVIVEALARAVGRSGVDGVRVGIDPHGDVAQADV